MNKQITKDNNNKYPFYRFPKALVKEEFKTISLEAKFLYVLLLDRAGLSKKNKWFDKNGNVFIYYKVQDICRVLGRGKDKIRKLLRELDDEYGIGLIRRVRQGQGKPDRIYVLSFLDDGKIAIKDTEYPPSEKLENSFLEDEENGLSLYNSNNERIIHTESNRFNQDKGMADLNEREAVRNKIKDNIDYEYFVQAYGFEKYENRPYGSIEELNELVETMVEVVCSDAETIRIGKESIPHSVVRDRMLSIDNFHMEYVLKCISENTRRVMNPKAYNITVLYNATLTMHSSLNAEFRRNNL